MGAVPVAATVNVALCPAVTVWLAGWLLMAGATTTGTGGTTGGTTGGVIGGVTTTAFVPVPVTVSVTVAPALNVKASVPVYVCTAVGENVTVPIRLCDWLSVTGSVGPEYTNAAEEDVMFTTCAAALLVLVSVTASGVLVPLAC